MRVVTTLLLAALWAPEAMLAQQQAPPPGPPATTPRPDAPAPAATSSSRTFTAPTGVIINAVRPERVDDFEKVLGHLQAALSSSANGTVRAQAQGWRMFKASEPGPNGAVLYVFLLDPAVAGADYGLGRILAEAYPDTATLQEIWRLYIDSLASGGSLLNLTPVQPSTPPASPAQPATPR